MKARPLVFVLLTIMWLLTLAAVVPGVVLMVRNWSVVIPGNWGIRGFQFVFAIVFLVVGSVVAWKQPLNPLGWILAVSGGIVSGFQAFIIEYATNALLVSVDPLPGGLTAAWLTNWVWVPIVGPLTVYVILLFPDGRLLTPRWRVVAWLSGLGMALTVIVLAILPGNLTNISSVRNPYGVEALARLDGTVQVVSAAPALLIPSIIAAVASLIARYRRADLEARQQLKWFALAAVLAALTLPLQSMFPQAQLFQIFFLTSLLGIPVAIGIAILRHRLYDIDVIINRTLVYGLLSAVLALLYFGIVTVVQTLFVGLTGEQSPLAVVVSTLVIAALFSPLRRRVQAFIDRRFYRSKYDAQRTLEAFGERTRDEVDLDRLREALLTTVEGTFQPEQLSLWLGEPGADPAPSNEMERPSVAIS